MRKISYSIKRKPSRVHGIFYETIGYMQITFLFDQNAYGRQKNATDLKRVVVETTL